MKRPAQKKSYRLTTNHHVAAKPPCPLAPVRKGQNIVALLQKYCMLNAAVLVAGLAVVYLCYSQIIDQRLAATSDTLSSVAEASLFVPYSLDHKQLVKIRLANIDKWRRYHQWTVNYDVMGIDRRSNLSLQEFWDVYDGKWPVLISDVVNKWPAHNWTGEFLNQHYGQEQVVMKAVDDGLSQAISLAVPLYRFYKNTDKAHPKSWTYVEDELFIPMRPELRKDIGETEYLQEDFFRLFPEDVRPWNAMLLWGTKYSRSSLHMDPYNWTGTNAVIQGRKWWKLYPPGQDEYLYVMKDKRSGFPLDCYKYNSVVDAFDPDLEKYPLFKKTVSILFEQLPGEILFIPSGWFHQAYNSEETLAISSQVMNRNNYRVVLEEILKVENIDRSKLPVDIDSLSPQQQVERIMSLLPRELLERGRTVTRNVLEKMKLKTNQYPDGEDIFMDKRHG